MRAPLRDSSQSQSDLLSPGAAGFRMPAEWERHESTWLSWPDSSEIWGEQLEAVQEMWVEMVRLISPGERVCLLVNDEVSEERAGARLAAGGTRMENVSFYRIPTVDVWIRDYGPIFIARSGESPEVGVTKWAFNAWGGKYEAYLQDDKVGSEIARGLGLPVFEPGLVLEGGSIDVNGQGSCLTTEDCLLSSSRNPQLTKPEIEGALKNYLGMMHVIWLGRGIEGDDTDGHIDNLARFVNATTVVCACEEDPRDRSFVPLLDNLERLKRAVDQDGRELRVISLPQPGSVDHEGARLPASYANFYITNQVVLVPIYHHPNDQRALEILRPLFPDRTVVGIPSAALLVGLGAIHCATLHQPVP